MQLADAIPERGDAVPGRLDDDLPFGFVLDFSFPVINRFHRRKEIDAGGEPLVDERAGERGAVGIGRQRRQDHHVFMGSCISSQVRPWPAGFFALTLYFHGCVGTKLLYKGLAVPCPFRRAPNREPRIESKRPAGTEPLRRKRALPASPSGFRRRAVHLLLVFVTVVLVVDALIGEKGLMQSMRARQQYRDMAASLETLRRNNAKLRDEMRRLNEDPATIEICRPRAARADSPGRGSCSFSRTQRTRPADILARARLCCAFILEQPCLFRVREAQSLCAFSSRC